MTTHLNKIPPYLIGTSFISISSLLINNIDTFEIYTYSTLPFSLNNSFLIARLIISTGLFSGVATIIYSYKIRQWYIYIIMFITILAIPQILSPPDHFVMQRYANQAKLNTELFKTRPSNYHPKQSSKNIICLFGAHCQFCKLAAKKLTAIRNKTKNKGSNIHYIFWGEKKKIQSFFEETNTPKYSYSELPDSTFLGITYGKMPLIVLEEDGEVKNIFGYRDMNEKEILSFLN